MIHDKQRGFTLIELLVGITIISIVFGVGYASFREFSRRQALVGVTKIIKGDLRLIQQLALTGEKNNPACDRLDSYTFDPTGTNTYDLVENCVSGDYVVKSKTLDSKVSISLDSGVVSFKVLGQGTNLSSEATLNLTHTVVGSSVDIVIGVGGEIR